MKNILRTLWQGWDFVVMGIIVSRFVWELWHHHWEMSWAYGLTMLFFFNAFLSDYRHKTIKELADVQRDHIDQLSEACKYYREIAIENLPEDARIRLRDEEAKLGRIN